MSLNITKENFETEVIKSEVPVLLDFGAAWCMPCKMLAPTLDSLSEEVGSSAKIAKINIDEQIELAQKYQIMSIPTLIVFKNGEIDQKVIGGKSKDELKAMLGI